MSSKFFIVLNLNENGSVLDFDMKVGKIIDMDYKTMVEKVIKTKCENCSYDLEFSLVQITQTEEKEEKIIIIESFFDDDQILSVDFDDGNDDKVKKKSLTENKFQAKLRGRKKIKKEKSSNQNIPTKEELLILEKNTRKSKNICLICNKTFKVPTSLKIHMQRCHTEKTFCCHLCGAAFALNKELEDHLARHQNPKPYQCDLCSERYAVKNSLKDHIQTVHIQMNEELFCNFCENSKKYPTETKLQEHVTRVHCGNDRYSCTQCKHTFKYPESLRNHQLRYHTPPELMKWYNCSQCNFRGVTAKALEKHKLVHLDNAEKPFKCSYCGKGFGRRYEWNRHEMIHRSEKPFICGICNHGVRTNYLLQKHMRVHQAGRPYSCSLCSKSYRDRDTYKKHIKIHAEQMEAKGEQLNIEAVLQNLSNIHKTIPIKIKSYPVIISTTPDDINGEGLLFTEVQDEMIIETSDV